MKHKFTKLSFLIAVLFISLNAFSAGTTTRVISVEETFDCSNANITSSSTTWVTYTAGNYSSRTNTCDNGSYPNLSGSTRTVVFYVSGVEKFTITAEGNSVNTRTLLYKIGSGSNIETAVYGAGCSSQTFSTGTTGVTTISISGNNGSIYLGKVTFSPPATPAITKFVAEGVEATINESAKTITAELPYGTNLASIEPVVTIGGTATSYGPPGAQDFSNSVTVPVVYTVSDGVNEVDYSVTLTASQTPSSEKDLSNVMIGGKIPTFDAGTNTYSITLPKAYDITSQVVTFTKPSTATADFTSGATHDFTNPLQITVTAQDASTKVYTLTALAGIADIAYVSTAATPHANDTKIYPMLLEKGYYVNVIAASGTDLTQFNPYDLVVLCENVSSSNTLALAMNGLIKSKRFLNFKAFMYNKTGWPTGTPSDGSSDADIAIATDYISHPIFSGVSISGNIANILTDPAVKGVQGVLNPASSSVIANLTSTGNTDKVAIIENNQMPTAKYMLIPIQTDSYSKVNANGLKLIENAITYLLTDSKFGPYTGSANINKTNIIFDGHTIQNPERQQLHVFDATGRMIVTSREDINMSAQAKGVYLVKGENGMMKIALTK